MKKKLGTLITLACVAVVALAIIILYFMPVTYMPNLSTPNHMIVYKTSSQSATLLPQDDKYKQIWGEYKNSFEQNMLSAIFAGQTKGIKNQTSSGELKTTKNEPTFQTYIVFNFDTAQKIVVAGHTQNVLVDQVKIEVSNATGYSDTTVYFRQVSGVAEQTNYYYMTTLASQSKLYQTIQDINI